MSTWHVHRYMPSPISSAVCGITAGESVALLVARRTNNRKVVGSRPANVVCITVWQVTAWGELSAVAGHYSFFRAVRSWSLRLSALMDSDLAWVNGKSGRQSWCYADAFKRSIISGAIYHFTIFLQLQLAIKAHSSISKCRKATKNMHY